MGLTLKLYKKRTRQEREQIREQIRILSSAGMPPRTVAKTLGVCLSAVSAIRAKTGLGLRDFEPLSAAAENRIVKLYTTKFGGSPAIAKKLNLPLHRVVQILQARKLIAQPGENGCRYGVTRQMKRSMRREFRAFQKRLAAKYKVSLIQVKRFLRERG